MSDGFVIDRGDHNSKNLQKWIEGEPERTFWLGLRTRGKDKFEVTTYRCDKCGYLESYAQNPVP